MRDLCAVCKNFREIVWNEEGTELPYCQTCLDAQPLTSDEWARILLVTPGSAVGPPFTVGDVVECRTAGVVYDGIGVISEMDVSFAHGGTPVYPTWRVRLTEKAHDAAPDERWYCENCLLKVTAPITEEVSS